MYVVGVCDVIDLDLIFEFESDSIFTIRIRFPLPPKSEVIV